MSAAVVRRCARGTFAIGSTHRVVVMSLSAADKTWGSWAAAAVVSFGVLEATGYWGHKAHGTLTRYIRARGGIDPPAQHGTTVIAAVIVGAVLGVVHLTTRWL